MPPGFGVGLSKRFDAVAFAMPFTEAAVTDRPLKVQVNTTPGWLGIAVLSKVG